MAHHTTTKDPKVPHPPLYKDPLTPKFPYNTLPRLLNFQHMILIINKNIVTQTNEYYQRFVGLGWGPPLGCERESGTNVRHGVLGSGGTGYTVH